MPIPKMDVIDRFAQVSCQASHMTQCSKRVAFKLKQSSTFKKTCIWIHFPLHCHGFRVFKHTKKLCEQPLSVTKSHETE